MGSGSVPGGPGRRVDPRGRGHRNAIRDAGHREPGQPCPGKQGGNRGCAPAVRRDVVLGAMRIAQRLARRGKLGVAIMAVAMASIRGGRDFARWVRETQAAVMSGQRELRPKQRRHREEGCALEPFPMTKAGHGLSLSLGGADATDPCQIRARSGIRPGPVAVGRAGRASEPPKSCLTSHARLPQEERPGRCVCRKCWAVTLGGLEYGLLREGHFGPLSAGPKASRFVSQSCSCRLSEIFIFNQLQSQFGCW